MGNEIESNDVYENENCTKNQKQPPQGNRVLGGQQNLVIKIMKK